MMKPTGHIRVNVPAWNGREIERGFSVLLGGKTGYAQRLRGQLESVLPGWSALPLSSGRYALTVAARALGLEGSRVVVPAYVCPAVLVALRAARAVPVACDCLPCSIRFDPEALSRILGKDPVAAIVACNTYGIDQDFDALKNHGLPVIDDAAYQTGRTAPKTADLCGTRGAAGIWSFNFKALSGVGGGVLLFRRDELRVSTGTSHDDRGEKVRFLDYFARSIGRRHIPRFLPGAEAPSPGLVSSSARAFLPGREGPMSELQAGVALAQWESRDRLARVQSRNSRCIAAAVEECAAFEALRGTNGEAMVHLFPLLVNAKPSEAQDVVRHVRRLLHSRGIQTESPYPIVLGTPSELPNVHDLASRLVLVPCNASLSERDVRQVADVLRVASSSRLVGGTSL